MANVLSPTFVIHLIRIGEIDGASCLNMGNNWTSDFTSYKKHNQGFGSVHGDNNLVRGIRSLLSDPDQVDLLGASDMGTAEEFITRLFQTGDRKP
ncbi:hypothetical protein JI721_12515 [Alicyclobacillus cycloheptanicus]|nr:hypothetical protein JI721_12515 [Alicyclobacillus cycloheptanicus]